MDFYLNRLILSNGVRLGKENTELEKKDKTSYNEVASISRTLQVGSSQSQTFLKVGGELAEQLAKELAKSKIKKLDILA